MSENQVLNAMLRNLVADDGLEGSLGIFCDWLHETGHRLAAEVSKLQLQQVVFAGGHPDYSNTWIIRPMYPPWTKYYYCIKEAREALLNRSLWMFRGEPGVEPSLVGNAKPPDYGAWGYTSTTKTYPNLLQELWESIAKDYGIFPADEWPPQGPSSQERATL